MTNKLDWELYEWWLKDERETHKNAVINNVVESVLENTENNPSYQPNATCNGKIQPILATRKGTKKCNVTAIPGSTIHIGDLIYVFGEYWLCMERYIDEYGIIHGEIWMCNHLFRFQNGTPDIIEKYGIIDDGSYSKGGEKAIVITDDKYNCYMSYDEESKWLYVDKRIALHTAFNAQKELILEVGKITWIDVKSKNYGTGSHLMTFRIDNDVYNSEKDNIQELICDFIVATEQALDESAVKEGEYISIDGRASIRIGTGRTYSASIIDKNGVKNSEYTDYQWSILNAQQGIELIPNGANCLLKIPLDASLVGSKLVIMCEDKNSVYQPGNKELAVINIG